SFLKARESEKMIYDAEITRSTDGNVIQLYPLSAITNWQAHICIHSFICVNDDPGSKETALVDKSSTRELDFSRPITPPPPELTRERSDNLLKNNYCLFTARLKERHSARCGAGGTVLSLPDHQADLVPNYKSH
ncbi:hypothetical protein ALC60_05168, partial [Trachymyrmex zeteki]